MKNLKLNAITLALAGALGIAGCADSGGSAGTAAKSTKGVITGFGSVFVNGVEYETGSASVTVDDAAGSEADLEVGMVVKLNGSVNADGSTGTANSIEFADDVEGYVDANGVASGGTTLTVMGQTVTVNGDTAFESYDPTHLAIADVPVGATIEVSGFSNGQGGIYATRIEEKDPADAGTETEVKGVVSGLNTTAMTFMVGNLTVDYSSATSVEAGLADGLYVEAEGSYDALTTTLAAAKVEMEDDGTIEEEGDEGQEVEMEGVITAAPTATEIEFNGQTMLLASAVEYEHGTAQDLAMDVKVKIEGEYNANGVLVVDEIEFKSDADLEMEGRLESVDSAAGMITLLDGKTVYVNNNTMMIDESATGERYFDLGDLIAGQDWVEVRAYKDDAGNLIATKLERDDNDGSDPASLEGKVTADLTASSQLEIEGVLIDLPAGYTPPALSVGTEVDVTWTYDASGVLTFSAVALAN